MTEVLSAYQLMFRPFQKKNLTSIYYKCSKKALARTKMRAGAKA
jgi:hypothetical protein